MSTLSWVLGRGGLLGSHVQRAISGSVWAPLDPFPWNQPTRLHEALAGSARQFRAQVISGPYHSWAIYWCAGAGVIGTSTAELAAETASFHFFLQQLAGTLPSNLTGRIFLASSAGGIYAGSPERPLTESSTPRPLSDYGRAKLDQERILLRWIQSHQQVSTLIGRISNLYGPGQRLEKPQGLISHISRCLIFNVPVQIYVPLDTIRDYLFVEDAARRIVAAMTHLAELATSRHSAQHISKIFSSENETTIGGVIGVFRQIAKRHLRVVTGINPLGSQQPRGLQFRSSVRTEASNIPRIQLLEGISRVHQHQLALFQSGRLARRI